LNRLLQTDIGEHLVHKFFWDVHSKQSWDAISPIFKFSTEVRKVIYTTNASESQNATCRKLNRQRRVFPSDTAFLKALCLSMFEATKKWTRPLRNWGQI
jgi:transposase-like protein